MDVDEVQRLPQHRVVDGRRQCQRVVRVFEEGVAFHLHFVEVDPLVKARQAEGLGVGDEVDLMPARGQPDPELGGDGAGTAVGRVAGDSDLHRAASATAPLAPARLPPRRTRHAFTTAACCAAGEAVPSTVIASGPS